MKLTFLGTGSGIPAKQRNVSSLAFQLLNKEGTIWLFDCGEATQHQILHTPLKLRKIDKIFITHLHGDHIYGLPGLLGTRSFQGSDTPLTVYGPIGIKNFIEVSLKVSSTYLRYPLVIKEFSESTVLFEDASFQVRVTMLKHGIPSFGYRMEQKASTGPLLISKIKEVNIPIGPHLKELKEGKTIILDDGRIFHGVDFVGSPLNGKVVTILGDTRYTDEAILLAKDADVLVHEATFKSDDHLLAKEYYHSTTTQAAEVAKKADAKLLILNHISSRYQGEEINNLLLEAQAVFPNTLIAEDLGTFDIP